MLKKIMSLLFVVSLNVFGFANANTEAVEQPVVEQPVNTKQEIIPEGAIVLTQEDMANMQKEMFETQLEMISNIYDFVKKEFGIDLEKLMMEKIAEGLHECNDNGELEEVFSELTEQAKIADQASQNQDAQNFVQDVKKLAEQSADTEQNEIVAALEDLFKELEIEKLYREELITDDVSVIEQLVAEQPVVEQPNIQVFANINIVVTLPQDEVIVLPTLDLSA
jgi:hypothetical protein